ncbi:MAG: hypothetical protein BWY63_01307 [Chloroflexi bacterium ADurb.Bin360]|nr:MAG: hypothetical protein BWY63_01307 [Chloroflexi bacterium ADurb.Bin360]
MKSEFALAFNQICADYNLPRDTVLEAVRAALVTAYRRDWKVGPTQNLTAEINMDTGLARIFLEKTVVEKVEDEDLEIAFANALRTNRDAALGDLLMVDVTPHNFGRIAAQTAKQVITQRLREAERESQLTRFSRQVNEIIIGTIQSINPQGITLHLERTEEAQMPRREQIPGERYRLHQKIRVYVVEVKRLARGPQIVVSRSHPAMLRRLMELEVPEIRSGLVEIKSIAREPGARSKIAVAARQPGVDPVGTCVGMRGIRIQTISRELNDERVDVIQWFEEPDKYISSALSLNSVLSVVLDEQNPGGKTAAVVVLDDQLSLAIGRAGQNARLAAKLTGWRIDIQGASEAAIWALQRVNEHPDLLAHQKDGAALVAQLMAILRAHEGIQNPYNDEERRVIKTVIEAVRVAEIARREKEHPVSHQTRARQAAQEVAALQQREAAAQARARVPQSAYGISLESLGLSEKVLGHLQRNGVTSAGEVMERIAQGDEALLVLTGIGAKALGEIKAAVEASDLRFVGDVEPEVVEAEMPELAASEVVIEAVAEEAAFEEPVTAEESGVTPLVEAESAPLSEVEVAAPTATEAVALETAAEAAPGAMAEAAPTVAAEEVVAGVAPEVGADESEEASATSIQDLFAVPFVVPEDEDEEEDESTSRRHKKGKRKQRTVFYDDEKGETFVVRKRRRGPANPWEDYAD